MSYDAYGRPTLRFPSDADDNGVVDLFDNLFYLNTMNDGPDISDPDYDPDSDLYARDGLVDISDYQAFLTLFSRTEHPIDPAAVSDYVGDDAPDSPLGFGSYMYHIELGMYHTRYRWYDPKSGRFLQRDPIGYADGSNLYLYAMASPWDGLDPWGLQMLPGSPYRIQAITEAQNRSEPLPLTPLHGYVPPPPAQTAPCNQGSAIGNALSYVGSRLDNMAAGAAAGGASGAAIGATVGGIAGAIGGAGVGAAPGAGIGAAAGGLGGLISGAVSGLLSPPDATWADSAKEGAVGGVIDGLTAGIGSKVVLGGKVATRVGSGVLNNADEAADLLKYADEVGELGNGSRTATNAIEDATEAAIKCPEGGTYILRDPVTGEVMRTGRTNNLSRRAAEHGRDPAHRDLQFEPVHRTDDYSQQRGLEQLLHETHRPPLNYINPISLRNPKLESYIEAARKFILGR